MTPHFPHAQTVRLSCGASLNILVWGPQNAPACMLIHGLDNNAHVWDNTARLLSTTYRVYAIEIRGHGESDWCHEDSYTLQTFVDDIEQVRAHFSLTNVTLIGHSLGGRISACYAATFSYHIRNLVLVDMGPEISNDVLNKLEQDNNHRPTYFLSLKECHEYMKMRYPLAQENILSLFCQHSFISRQNRFFNKTDPSFISKMFQPSNESGYSNPLQDKHIWDVMAKISTETLIIRGSYSAVLSAAIAQKMTEILSNASIRLIERAGHAVMLDNPQQVSQVILDFMHQSRLPAMAE